MTIERFVIIFSPILFLIILPTNAYSQGDVILPAWIKTNVQWWSEDKVSDEEFVSAMEFLVKSEVISSSRISILDDDELFMKNLEEKTTPSDIPQWIKKNAKWWASGSISDADFISGIEFMIEEKIIQSPTIEVTKQIKTEDQKTSPNKINPKTRDGSGKGVLITRSEAFTITLDPRTASGYVGEIVQVEAQVQYNGGLDNSKDITVGTEPASLAGFSSVSGSLGSHTMVEGDVITFDLEFECYEPGLSRYEFKVFSNGWVVDEKIGDVNCYATGDSTLHDKIYFRETAEAFSFSMSPDDFEVNVGELFTVNARLQYDGSLEDVSSVRGNINQHPYDDYVVVSPEYSGSSYEIRHFVEDRTDQQRTITYRCNEEGTYDLSVSYSMGEFGETQRLGEAHSTVHCVTPTEDIFSTIPDTEISRINFGYANLDVTTQDQISANVGESFPVTYELEWNGQKPTPIRGFTSYPILPQIALPDQSDSYHTGVDTQLEELLRTDSRYRQIQPGTQTLTWTYTCIEPGDIIHELYMFNVKYEYDIMASGEIVCLEEEGSSTDEPKKEGGGSKSTADSGDSTPSTQTDGSGSTVLDVYVSDQWIDTSQVCSETIVVTGFEISNEGNQLVSRAEVKVRMYSERGLSQEAVGTTSNDGIVSTDFFINRNGHFEYEVYDIVDNNITYNPELDTVSSPLAADIECPAWQ